MQCQWYRKHDACSVFDTACTITENRSYLGEFEAEIKKALACESGPQGVLFDEKTEGLKSRDSIFLSMLVKDLSFTLFTLRRPTGSMVYC
jgi:hypothetical protein